MVVCVVTVWGSYCGVVEHYIYCTGGFSTAKIDGVRTGDISIPVVIPFETSN